MRITPGKFSRRDLLAAGAIGLLAGSVPAVARQRDANAFIRRLGNGFVRNGKSWRHTGANAWYLAWLGSEAAYGNRARLIRELDALRDLDVTNVRLLAGDEEGPLKNAVSPGFVDRDGHFNEQLFAGLDYAIAEIARRGMTAVLYLTNNWEWSGGMMTRLWYETGHYIDNNDPAHPWPEFPDAVSGFYGNADAVRRFCSYAGTLIARTNTVTGVTYRDDPAIMAWQLCNEPRPGSSPSVMAAILPAYYGWIDSSAAFIRKLDPNHMVSLGMEGTIATNGNEDIVLRAHRNIDYLTAHVWPLNWGWVDGKNLAGTWDAGKARVEDYLATHIRLANAAGKPLVIEEFGFPRDDELYDPAASTRFRERYYELIYAAAEHSLANAGPIAGTNFWAWNGEARTSNSDHRFRLGDTQYMGDPPHEPQGWYGNFNSDSKMLAIIRKHAAHFATPG